jgi:hypothetical protein
MKQTQQNKGVTKQCCNEGRNNKEMSNEAREYKFFGKPIFQVGHIYIQEREAKASWYH